jgi:hypothetical protein
MKMKSAKISFFLGALRDLRVEKKHGFTMDFDNAIVHGL